MMMFDILDIFILSYDIIIDVFEVCSEKSW